MNVLSFPAKLCEYKVTQKIKRSSLKTHKITLDTNDNIGTPVGLSSFSMASFTDYHYTPPQIFVLTHT